MAKDEGERYAALSRATKDMDKNGVRRRERTRATSALTLRVHATRAEHPHSGP
jgi:hypothetical protein